MIRRAALIPQFEEAVGFRDFEIPGMGGEARLAKDRGVGKWELRRAPFDTIKPNLEEDFEKSIQEFERQIVKNAVEAYDANFKLRKQAI